MLLIAEKLFNMSFILTIYRRIETLKEFNLDLSFNLRLLEIARGIEQWKNHIFMGSGLGATYERIMGVRVNDGIDNTYIFILWKMGIIGILSFLLIYVIFTWQGLKSYWSINNKSERVYIVGLFCGIIGIMIVALSNMSIIKYRFNIVWAIVIALIHNIYFRRIQSKNV